MNFDTLNLSLSRISDIDDSRIISPERNELVHAVEICESGVRNEFCLTMKELYSKLTESRTLIFDSNSYLDCDLNLSPQSHNDIYHFTSTGNLSSLQIEKHKKKLGCYSRKDAHNINSNRSKYSSRFLMSTNVNQSRRQHTEVPQNVVSSSITKLRLRDFRRLDPYQNFRSFDDVSMVPEEKLLVVRKGCILFSSQWIRAIIFSDSVVIMERFDEIKKIVPIVFFHLQGNHE